MHLIEKSEFVRDNDDDEKLGLMRSIDEKLHARRQSGNVVKEKGEEKKKKGRGKRSLQMRMKAKSASLALRSVFTKKSIG